MCIRDREEIIQQLTEIRLGEPRRNYTAIGCDQALRAEKKLYSCWLQSGFEGREESIEAWKDLPWRLAKDEGFLGAQA